LIFIDSDSVTNVTSLNRVNQRRVLLFIGNGSGLISYGKGKGEDYEQAFDNAFKLMRQNLVCLSLDNRLSCLKHMEGRHNDFKIKIYPQMTPNYWGNP
jgi:small subunit ribosomal protein S5